MADYKVFELDTTIHTIKLDIRGDFDIYMDISNVMEAAAKEDERNNYGSKGPAQAWTVNDAIKYAEYVEKSQEANRSDITKFNTDVYTFFTETKNFN